MILSQILLVFAFVLFAISAFVYPSPAPSPWGWGRFIAAGLAFWVLSLIMGSFHI
jgi:hypothetical protein